MNVGTLESKHVTSELVRSIFDVDKMLYFVAPEWWSPRLTAARNSLASPQARMGVPVRVEILVRFRGFPLSWHAESIAGFARRFQTCNAEARQGHAGRGDRALGWRARA